MSFPFLICYKFNSHLIMTMILDGNRIDYIAGYTALEHIFKVTFST